MKPIRHLCLSILASSCLLAAQEGGDGGAKPPVPKLSIAVVDIVKAAGHTKTGKSGLERLKGMKATFEQRLEKMTEERKSLEAELAILKDGEERIEAEIKLRALAQRQRLAAESYQKALADQQVENDRLMYREVEKAIAELAKKRGILLVLRKREDLSLGEVPDERVDDAKRRQSGQDRVRDVIYSAASIDLTEDVIKLLKG